AFRDWNKVPGCARKVCCLEERRRDAPITSELIQSRSSAELDWCQRHSGSKKFAALDRATVPSAPTQQQYYQKLFSLRSPRCIRLTCAAPASRLLSHARYVRHVSI